MEVYKLDLIFFFFVPMWMAFLHFYPPERQLLDRYSGTTMDIDIYNKLHRKLFCIFPLPVPKSLMSRWDNNVPLWGLLGPSGTLKYLYATFQLLLQPHLGEMCSDAYQCTENRTGNDKIRSFFGHSQIPHSASNVGSRVQCSTCYVNVYDSMIYTLRNFQSKPTIRVQQTGEKESEKNCCKYRSRDKQHEQMESSKWVVITYYVLDKTR